MKLEAGPGDGIWEGWERGEAGGCDQSTLHEILKGVKGESIGCLVLCLRDLPLKFY